jgi:hypothetical protein
MRFLNICDNYIVMRFLDNIIVTAGLKFYLEYLGIEGNKRVYEPTTGCCIGGGNSNNQKESVDVSPQQIMNRNTRV